jgi:hypothetical protein
MLGIYTISSISPFSAQNEKGSAPKASLLTLQKQTLLS